jgi:hypothetical protein
MPKSTEHPDDATGRVLSSMRASGADMTARYDIDFEHIFPDLRAAEDFRDEFERIGHRVELSEYDDDSSKYFWQVRVVVRMVPTHAEITHIESELEAMAQALGGESDGWGILH